MRALNPSERRLLFLLLGAVFIALNMGAIKIWMDFSAAQDAALAAAKRSITEGQAWILTAQAIGKEADNNSPPPTLSRSEASSALLDSVRESASAAGLTVEKESLPPPEEDLPEEAVSVRLRVSGPFSGLVNFLYQVQPVGGWRAIEDMVVKADPKPQNVLAELQIRQYFTPSQGGAAPGPVPSDSARPAAPSAEEN